MTSLNLNCLFGINIFHWKGQIGKIGVKIFTTFCVDMSFV